MNITIFIVRLIKTETDPLLLPQEKSEVGVILERDSASTSEDVAQLRNSGKYMYFEITHTMQEKRSTYLATFYVANSSL